MHYIQLIIFYIILYFYRAIQGIFILASFVDMDLNPSAKVFLTSVYVITHFSRSAQALCSLGNPPCLSEAGNPLSASAGSSCLQGTIWH